jgi:hypothetical protein
MSNITKLLHLSYQLDKASATDACLLIPQVFSVLRDARGELSAFLHKNKKSILDLPTTYEKNGRSGFQSMAFFAWTKSGKFGLGHAEGRRIYFEGKTEDYYNDPVCYWHPI